MKLKNLALALVLFIFVLAPSLAHALNTTEPIGAGVINVESYFAIEHIRKDDLSIANDIALGFGISDSFDLSLSFTQATEVHGLGRPCFASSIGISANAIDTAIFDMDLIFDFGIEDIGKDAKYIVHPSFEFNFDADPEMLTWGIYARIGFPMYVESEDAVLGEERDAHRFQMDLSFSLGCYCRIAEIHRLLVEQSVVVHHFSKAYTLDPFAVGYNIVLRDDFELISQASFTLPVNDESFAAHFVVGFIWAL